MKNVVIAGLFLVFALSQVQAQPLEPRLQRQQQQQPPLQRGLRPNERPNARGGGQPGNPNNPNMQDAVLAFYVNQFRQGTEVSPEVYNKALPFLIEFVQDRFEISRRRTRILNALRQTVNTNGSDDDLKRLVRDLDAADVKSQESQTKFFSNIDPLLNPRQQARARIRMNVADNRLREMLNAAQNPTPNAPPPPDPNNKP